MTPTLPSVLRSGIAQAWSSRVPLELLPDESPVSGLELDLDGELVFARTALILTEQRLLACQEDEKKWQQWVIEPDWEWQTSDHAGVGRLELFNAKGRLGAWRYTLGLQPAVNRWLDRMRLQMASLRSDAPLLEPGVAERICPQ